MPTTDVKSLRQRITSNPAVREAFKTAKSEQQRHRDKLNELNNLLHPEQTVSDMRKMMERTSDPDQINKCSEIISRYSGDHAQLAKGRAFRLCSRSFHQFTASLPPLLDAIEDVAQDVESEALVAETALFSGFGLPREETGVSRRAKEFAAKARRFRKGLANDHLHHAITNRVALSHILDFCDPEK